MARCRKRPVSIGAPSSRSTGSLPSSSSTSVVVHSVAASSGTETVTNDDLDTASYHENATGYVLTREAMRWFWRHYLAREEQGKEAGKETGELEEHSMRGLGEREFDLLPHRVGLLGALRVER